MSMTLNEYQHRANLISGFRDKISIERLTCAAMGLAGEAGELIDALKKMRWHGHEFDMHKLMEEGGDALYYLADICSALGVTLEYMACQNNDKLETRYGRDFSYEKSRDRTKINQLKKENDD